MKYAALFIRKDSAYKERPDWDCYDADRDATKYDGSLPCAVHPPCRSWGRLSHMTFRSLPENEREVARECEKELALFAVKAVRGCGGVLEHPSGSRLFGTILPDVGDLPDEFGGWTIEIDQFDFGHVAHKKTKLYLCGVRVVPSLPPKRMDKTDRSICGNVPGTKRCTQYQREYTPPALIDWIEEVLDAVSINYRRK